MANAPLGAVVEFIHRIASDQAYAELSDSGLVKRFLKAKDEKAFVTLLKRHGPMVLSVSRRVLGSDQDVEDIFQATFLLLARKAKSIRTHESVASWLYGVAQRLALNLKRSGVNRQTREKQVAEMSKKSKVPDKAWQELQTVLHEALAEVPEKYRAALLLCYLEGKTQEDAARQLGCPIGTVRSRLARGRDQLQKLLHERGVPLSATALATAFGANTASAAVGYTLVRTTAKAAVEYASGRAATALVSAKVAVLVEEGMKAMMTIKLKAVTAVVFMIGTLGVGAGVVKTYAVADSRNATQIAQKSEVPVRQERAKPSPTKGENAEDTRTFTGRVLGPEKKPVVGARLYYHFITFADEAIPVRATTDGQGRFSFTLTSKDVPLSADKMDSDPLKTGQIVAKADGFTIAWALAAKQVTDFTLHVAKDDTPIEGRILDLEGKPLVGLRVSTVSASASESGDLSGLVKGLQSGEPFYDTYFKNAPNFLANFLVGRTMARFLPSAMTDANGRFRLYGFAKEQLVELRIEGDAIETQHLFVVTRAKPAGADALLTVSGRVIEPEMYAPQDKRFVRWNGFDHAAPPGQIVTGTVRDEATQKPIPGAIVESYMLAGTKLAQNTIYNTVADDRGRFRLTGLPRGRGNQVRVRPPKDLAYLPVVKDVPPWNAAGETALDAGLQRGVWVDVAIKDKSTGKPVPGRISYFVLPEKPAKGPRFERPFADAYNNFMPVRTDGTFRFVAVQRRAIIAFRTDWDKYPIPTEAATIRLPGHVVASNYQAFAEIDPKADDELVKVEFVLDTGGIAKGKVVGLDAQPIAGALVTGLHDDWSGDPAAPLRTAEFTAIGLKSDRPRLLCFSHEDKKLASSIVVRGDEKGPITVKLVPWAVVSGRLLDEAGKPIKNATLDFTEVPRQTPGTPLSLDTGIYVTNRSAYAPRRDPHTDEDGRFRVEGLVPGLKYNLALYEFDREVFPAGQKWMGLAFTDLILQTGETKDLGDLKLRPFPKGEDK
jgi:RNA polymerase sigma factor (sigma-70 family)